MMKNMHINTAIEISKLKLNYGDRNKPFSTEESEYLFKYELLSMYAVHGLQNELVFGSFIK